jgi:hypothetical protein
MLPRSSDQNSSLSKNNPIQSKNRLKETSDTILLEKFIYLSVFIKLDVKQNCVERVTF